MNFDLSQFDDLELENIGQWPSPVKLVATLALAVAIVFLGYMLFVSGKMDALDRISAQESTLREEFRSKYHIAANLDLFKEQMVEAENVFANQLRSLPNRHEIPGLLDEVTFIGTTSGLDFVKINWQPEVVKEIYTELPIDIEVIGTYHQFGKFVSGVASLPRIVTLHDFQIDITALNSELLSLKLQAKTYRYQETEH